MGAEGEGGGAGRAVIQSSDCRVPDGAESVFHDASIKTHPRPHPCSTHHTYSTSYSCTSLQQAYKKLQQYTTDL